MFFLFCYLFHSLFSFSVKDTPSAYKVNLEAPPDSLMAMEKRLQGNLTFVQDKLDSLNQNLMEFTSERIKHVSKNSHTKQLDDQIESLREALRFQYKMRNVLNEMLGTTRQLPFQSNDKIQSRLKEMRRHLNRIDHGQLPDYYDQIQISSEPYQATATDMASRWYGIPCKKYMSQDGKIYATSKEPWFSHTDSNLYKYFKNQEFLEVSARILYTQKSFFLEVEFVVNSLKAADVLGYLDPNSPVRMDFMNGHHIYLQTFAQSDLRINRTEGQSLYEVQYQLDSEDLRELSKYELDTITIVWTRGAERYEIAHLDLIKQLLECVQTKN